MHSALNLRHSASESHPEPPSSRQSSAEPSPEWEHAIGIWGGAWTAHWVGFSVLFMMLATITGITTIRLYIRQKKNRKSGSINFSLAILIIVIILGISRSLFLFINPYESTQCIAGEPDLCPIIVARILYSLGIPSITSAFILLYVALVKVVKVSGIQIKQLQNWKFLVSIVALSYLLAVISDIIVAFYAHAIALVTICQGYFILLSILLLAAGLQGGLQIILKSRKCTRTLSSFNSTGPPQLSSRKHPVLRKVLIFTISTTTLALMFLGCQIYALSSVHVKDLQVVGTTDPWSWFSYHTVFRFTELFIGWLLFYVASSKPSKKWRDSNSSRIFSKISKRDSTQKSHNFHETLHPTFSTLSAVNIPQKL